MRKIPVVPLPVLEPLLSVEDVATILNVSRAKVYELIRSNDLPSVKFSKFRRIEPTALARWIEQHREKPGEQQHDRWVLPAYAERQKGKRR